MGLAYTGYVVYDQWHCLGRVDDPVNYPECYDTHPRSSNRHKFPKCHPTCHLPYLALKFKDQGLAGNRVLGKEETPALLDLPKTPNFQVQAADQL